MRPSLVPLFALAAAAAPLAACSAANGEGAPATGSGNARTYQVGDFHSVSSAGAYDVVVTVGGAPAVRAEGDEEALDHLVVRVDNGNLSIGPRRGWNGRSSGRVTVHVTAPRIDGASVAGSGDMRIDRVRAGDFSASVAGSGNVDIAALEARRAEFSLAGSGGVRAAGAAEAAEVSIAGSGNAALDRLALNNAEVSIAGSGEVALRATGEVRGAIMGSGNLSVAGGARCAVSSMGSGRVNCGG